MGCFTQFQRTVTNCIWKPTNSLICSMCFHPKTFHTEQTFCQLNLRKELHYDYILETQHTQSIIKISTYLKFFIWRIVMVPHGAIHCFILSSLCQQPAIFEHLIPVLQSAWAPALKYTSKRIQPITSLEKGMWMCLI